MNEIVSIIVPCYNVEKYVRRCIESLFAQTYPSIEIVVVNDCSTDDTLSVLKSLKREMLTNINGGG